MKMIMKLYRNLVFVDIGFIFSVSGWVPFMEELNTFW